MYQLNSGTILHFELLHVITLATAKGADVGEVLQAIEKVEPSDLHSYHLAFKDLAERVYSRGEATNSKLYPVSSARGAYFRTASYFHATESYLYEKWEDPRIEDHWVTQMAAFIKQTRYCLNLASESYCVRRSSLAFCPSRKKFWFYLSLRERKL